MNELKPEDVMRGLECCQSVTPLDCRRCPYKDQTTPEYKSCCNLLVADALALLREKDTEIERLTKERDDARRDCAVAEQLHYECKKELEEMLDDILDSVRAERDRYKAESERYQSALLKYCGEHEYDYSRGWNEAITEFEKKLMEKKCHYTETEHTFNFDGVTVEDIEQTAKELKGEPDEL